MKRVENLFRLFMAALFSVCAVGAFSNGEYGAVALFLLLSGLFVWRANKTA